MNIQKDHAEVRTAAPELLAALEEVARWINTLPEEIRLGSIMPDKLRDVIAKAKDRQ